MRANLCNRGQQTGRQGLSEDRQGHRRWGKALIHRKDNGVHSLNGEEKGMLAMIIMNTSGRTILITVKVAVEEEDGELVNMKDGESGHQQLVESWRRGNG